MRAGDHHLNFSGVWRLNLERSRLSFLSKPTFREDRIEHAGSLLTVTTRQRDSNGDNTVTRQVEIGGPGREIEVLGKSRNLSARWEGAALIVEQTWDLDGSTRTVSDEWTLAAGGNVLKIRRRFSQRGGSSIESLHLDRQDPPA